MSYSDSIDQGTDMAALHTAAAIAAQQRKMAPEQVQNPDGSWPVTECLACGDDIPLPRIQMGKVRCVFCQERRERNA